jgi:hypothetical protein
MEEEYTTPSDHELIVFDWQDIELYQTRTPYSQDITGWDIDKLLKNEKSQGI